MEGGSAPRELVNADNVAPARVFAGSSANPVRPPQVVAASHKEAVTISSSIAGISASGFYAQVGKRIFDFAFATMFMLVLGFWLLPFLALLIRLDSKGPAFFRQKRVGKNGQLFSCLKFRTMTHDPNARFEQAKKGDARITRMGRILRKTNLDELPQFINVLRGDMSVVGPRPHVPQLDSLFGGLVPGYMERNTIRPGVTGLAQVSGCRGETRSVREMTHRIRFDLFYGRNVGLMMDIKIIIATVWCALAGDQKAY